MKTGTLRPLKLAIIWSSALVASEWLFFATMPSFMSRLDWTDKLLTLAAASAIFVFLVVIALVLAGIILKVFGTTGARAYRYLSAAVASALLTILLVLLVDNFTYTLFEFGLRSIRSLASAILYILLIIWLYLRIFRWTIVQTSMAADEAPPYRKWEIAIQLLAVITAGVLWAPWSDDKPAAGGNLQSRPNILIVGGDALEAFHMSVYGYQRNTTPFLANKRDEFLVSANSFTNNAVTLGSNIALLTGKYPAGTGVIYPPNILTGRDQFEHLPGLLRSMGYRTADMSVRWTADPGDAGMRCGFEFANFRKLDECVGDAGAMQRLYAGLSVSIVLLEQISDRIVERLTILNPLTGTEYSAGGAIRAGQPDSYWLKDDARVREAIRFMNSFSGNHFYDFLPKFAH